MKQEATFKSEMDSITKACTQKKYRPFPHGFGPTVPVNLDSLILTAPENKAEEFQRLFLLLSFLICISHI